MRKYLLLLLTTAMGACAYSQDFSNKGKDFWIGYANHVRMYNSQVSQQEKMSLYITSDVNTSGSVDIPGIGFSQAFSVIANQILVIDIPRTARLNDDGLFNLGIHVTALRPIVVYAHIYAMNVSGATVCLPTNTLGKEYFSVNYTQLSNESPAYSYMLAIATEDNTTIEITPTTITKQGWLPGSVHSVSLNKGQIYQVLADQDLTGSTIKSVANTGGCKRIAVFCGSGKVYIRNPACTNNSADNLFQQMYPTSTWGKNYITVSSKNNQVSDQTNIYRVMKGDPTAIVYVDGSIVPNTSFTNGFYYEFNGPGVHVITSDKPIMVAQYFTTENCYGNGAPGDPEMIYLNPLEQTINNVTLYSTQYFQITQHFVNIVIKNEGTALSSLKIDGSPVGSSFSPVPLDPTYVYARIAVQVGTHNISSDSGFNAIAYGFGTAESYGYSAGTNLKDLYQYVTIQNEYGIVNFPAGCKNSPLKFAMTFPYQPTQIVWQFGSTLNGMGLTDTTINNPVYDSTWVINGRTLYRYKLNRYSTITATGTYPIKVIANNPTSNGCSGEQEIDYDLQIFDPPAAAFTVSTNGCLSDSVAFFDNTNGQGRPVIRWAWDFGDAGTANTRNPKHKYANAGPYTIHFSAITDVGCISDTAQQTISISNPPVADFSISPLSCVNSSILFTDQSNPSGSTLAKWRWDFGDGQNLVATNGNPIAHTYITIGAVNVSLQVESSTGCKSNTVIKPLTIHPTPHADFQLPTGVCIPQSAQFLDQSTISDGTAGSFGYLWQFGDGGNSNQQNPTHAYANVGPFNVKLRVTSSNGCIDSATKIFNTVYPQPHANFTVSPEVCLGDATSYTDQSNGNGSAIARWRWDFGDGQTDTVKNPTHTYANATSYVVKLFVYSDKGCISDTNSNSTIVNPLPTANFNYSSPTCETKGVNFTDASVANAGVVAKWNWNFGDGGLSVLQNPMHTFSPPNTYVITLNVETNKGCKSSAFMRPVKVNYLPVADFGLPEVCLRDPYAQFTDSSRISDNSASQFTYLWNFGDPYSTAANPNTSTQKDPQHRYSKDSIYSVRLTVTSKDGCSRDTSKQFTVNGSLPQAAFQVNNINTLCSSNDVSLVNNSTVDFGSIVKVEIYWDYLNDPTKKTVDDYPTPGKMYSFKYPEFGTPVSKQYEILYVAYSGINCVSTTTKTITVLATPQIEFDAMSGVCEEVPSFQLNAAKETSGLAGTGVFSGAGVSPGGIFNPATAKAGVHSLRYTFNATNGCTAFKEQTINVFPTPSVNLGPDRTVLEGGYITIIPTTSGNNLTYLWTPATGLNNDKIASPKVSPPTDMTYQLTVTSSDGCVASDQVFVKLLKEVKVPNAFSPNNDGINDKWEIQYLESYPGCTIDVFNRYGQTVFHSVGYNKPWDGTFNGTPLPVATYYWVINPKNGRQPMTGSVTIIR
jgi:gliding motility-associated-like protein